MSKIREAAERWLRDYPEQVAPCTATEVGLAGYEAGYQAAIAAIREGGAVAFASLGDVGDIHTIRWITDHGIGDPKTTTPLYKLPEDLL